MEAELVSDLGSVHGVLYSRSAIAQTSDHIATHGKILLVGEDQKERIAKFVLVEHSLQLLTSLNNAISVVGIDHEDDTLGILEVVAPQRPDLVLSSDVPHSELNVLVLDGLNVEA